MGTLYGTQAAPVIRPGRPAAELAAELAQEHQPGPPSPYHFVANWPNPPKCYNYGESSGVGARGAVVAPGRLELAGSRGWRLGVY